MLFRKRPVIVEAMKFEYTGMCIQALQQFTGGQLGKVSKERHIGALAELEIGTLEDGTGKLTVKHIATEGDWIIKGVHGEFYACKPDIFELTYEPV